MRAISLLLPCVALMCGCTVLKQKSNQFVSTSTVGYVGSSANFTPTKLGAKGNSYPIITALTANWNVSDVPTPGDCIVIEIADGFINQTYETWVEKKMGQPRSEFALTAHVYEVLDSTSLHFNDDGWPDNTELSVYSWAGQLERRPIPLQSVSIYGPRRYQGGDLVFSLNLNELDKEEISSMKGDVGGFTSFALSSVPEAERGSTIADLIRSKAAVKEQEPPVESEKGSALVRFVTSGNYAALVNATAELSKLYLSISEDNDSIMGAKFALTSGRRAQGVPQTPLRFGLYPIARIAVGERYPLALKESTYSPAQGWVTTPGEGGPLTSVTLRANRAFGCSD